MTAEDKEKLILLDRAEETAWQRLSEGIPAFRQIEDPEKGHRIRLEELMALGEIQRIRAGIHEADPHARRTA